MSTLNKSAFPANNVPFDLLNKIGLQMVSRAARLGQDPLEVMTRMYEEGQFAKDVSGFTVQVSENEGKLGKITLEKFDITDIVLNTIPDGKTHKVTDLIEEIKKINFFDDVNDDNLSFFAQEEFVNKEPASSRVYIMKNAVTYRDLSTESKALSLYKKYNIAEALYLVPIIVANPQAKALLEKPGSGIVLYIVHPDGDKKEAMVNIGRHKTGKTFLDFGEAIPEQLCGASAIVFNNTFHKPE
jgi:hypothetical protein